MRRITFNILLVLTFLVSCSSPTTPTSSPDLLHLEDCVLTTGYGVQFDARCGTLSVPEDRAHPEGRKIEVAVAVIPAVNDVPEPDALFLLAGGPGQSAIETLPPLLLVMTKTHQNRDIVLVDQRGTGKSNPLKCLHLENEILGDKESLETLQSCPKELNGDVRFYHTEIAMQDLDEIRSALGYEKINLYGISYGTRAALTYLRMFPERVRTITLDAVVDPAFVIYRDTIADGQAALERFFSRCEMDDACKTSFPNLRTEFNEILARLEQQPAEINIPHPLTYKPLQMTVTRQMVVDMVFNTLYLPDLTATLPLSIHTAYADGNYAPLITQAFMVNAKIYDGMYYAVTCTEDAPFLSADESAQHKESIFGNQAVNFAAICAAWQKGQISPEFRQPVVSDVPALLFSGEADPITPPYRAEEVARHLSNSLHLVFPGMGHGNLIHYCGAKLFEAFIETASIHTLDTSCMQNIQPPPFFVDFSGPRP